jgi:hypothetical protein
MYQQTRINRFGPNALLFCQFEIKIWSQPCRGKGRIWKAWPNISHRSRLADMSIRVHIGPLFMTFHLVASTSEKTGKYWVSAIKGGRRGSTLSQWAYILDVIFFAECSAIWCEIKELWPYHNTHSEIQSLVLTIECRSQTPSLKFVIRDIDPKCRNVSK